MKKQIRIGIAEDHDIVIEGLVSLFENYEDIKVVFTANNGEELLKKIKAIKTDIILLDLEMPIMSGKEAFEIIKREYPDLKIIIISGEYRKSYIVEYIKKGVNAFLPKNCEINKIIEAIVSVNEKGTYYNAEVTDMLVKALSEKDSHSKKVEFSEKELAIIKLICADKSSKEIAQALSLSTRTVEWHRSVILTKIDAKSVSAIVKYAIRHKIVEL